MSKSKFDVLVILGPTASGKTNLAVVMANLLDTEIISADSRQVYRGMNIGTGKDLGNYLIDGNAIPYHLIDIIEAGEEYNLASFQKDFAAALQIIKEKDKLPILCGGTGLYIQAVLQGYQNTKYEPDAALRTELNLLSDDELINRLKQIQGSTPIDTSTRKRIIRGIEIAKQSAKNIPKDPQPKLKPLIIGINPSQENRRNKITQRLKERLESQGMVNEVEKLLASGISPDKLIYYGLEYKYLTQYVLKQISYNQMFKKLETEIHRYAKRQMTFFRSMEKKGLKIHWIDGDLPIIQIKKKAFEILNKFNI